MSGSNRALNVRHISVSPPSQRLADLANVASTEFEPIKYLSKVAQDATERMQEGAAIATVCVAFAVAGGIWTKDARAVVAPLLFSLPAAIGAATARTRRQEAEALILTAQTSARTRPSISSHQAYYDAFVDVSQQRAEHVENLRNTPGIRARMQVLPGLGGLFQSR